MDPLNVTTSSNRAENLASLPRITYSGASPMSSVIIRRFRASRVNHAEFGGIVLGEIHTGRGRLIKGKLVVTIGSGFKRLALAARSRIAPIELDMIVIEAGEVSDSLPTNLKSTPCNEAARRRFSCEWLFVLSLSPTVALVDRLLDAKSPNHSLFRRLAIEDFRGNNDQDVG